MAVKMKELPNSEKPYEKLEMYGEHSLSSAELIAIIIKTGTKEESSVTLAQKILSLGKEKKCKEDNLKFLQELSIEELTQIHGIGRVKAIQLKAVCELAKRIAKPMETIKVKIKSPQELANIVMDELKAETREIVKVVMLNSKNLIIQIQTISIGGANFACVEPKDVLKEAIKKGVPTIALIHNHPSGDPTPSKQDIAFTNKIQEISQMLGIQFLDHIIIGDAKYTSMRAYLLIQERKNQNQ